MDKSQAKKVALVVEGVGGHAQVVLDALMRDELSACKVIVKHDGIETLDYLLGRRAYAERNLNVMPCVMFIDLALPLSDGPRLLRQMRTHKQTRLLPVVAFFSAGEPRQADPIYALGANSYIGIRPGCEQFEESIRRAARYWCAINDPPPPL